MATFREISRDVALRVGIPQPDSVIGNPDLDALRLGAFVNETGEELCRRFDWGVLVKDFDFAGTGTAVTQYQLPANYKRLIKGSAVHNIDGSPVRGGLSHSEAAALQALVAAAPAAANAKYFDMTGTKVWFYPPLATSAMVRVKYVTEQWATNALGTVPKTFCDDDTDIPLLPAELLRLGGVWRWRRHVENSFQDQMAEYEAALAALAGEDVRTRTGV
jgi:hypothetical protein